MEGMPLLPVAIGVAGVVVLIGLAVAGIVALAVWQAMAMRKRREAIQVFCSENGHTYLQRDDLAHRRYAGFEPFNRSGSSRRARNIVRGRFGGHDFEVMQYQFTVQSGKSSTTHHFRVACMRMPLHAQALTVRPEHIGHKIFDALGGEDIDFASDEFSRRFWVRCQDRRFAYDVLHPAMQEWLLAQPRRVWQWDGDRLVIHDSGRLHVHQIEPMLQCLAGFATRLPRHMLAEASN